jgi:hypothetical protein
MRLGLQRGHGGGGVGVAAGLRAGLLAADLVGRAQRPSASAVTLAMKGSSLAGACQFHSGLPASRTRSLMAAMAILPWSWPNTTAPSITLFGQLVGLGLDHQHGGFGAGDDQVHLAVEQLRLARVQHVLAVDVAHAGGADRAVERDAGDRQRGAGADHRGDVGLHLGVQAQHVDDHLHFVEEAVREQRADRAVDQARGQRLELARAAFALEEAARDLAGGVGLLDVVDGQREEVLAGLGTRSWRPRWRAPRCLRC